MTNPEIPRASLLAAVNAYEARRAAGDSSAEAMREALSAAALPHLRVQETPMTEEERGFVELALQAVDAGDAGHWPTVAGYLADEVRRLRATPAPRQADDDACQGNQRGSGKPCDCPACTSHPRPVVDREAVIAALHNYDHGHQWGEPICERYACEHIYPARADAVLALLPTEEAK